MHKLISRGAKFLLLSVPRTYFIPRVKFSSQIESQIQNGDHMSISRNLYSEDEYRRIEEIQQMPYQNLLEEVKKYSNKPKSRAKNTLIQFLIDQVPKKGVVNSNQTLSQEFELQDQRLPHRGEYQHDHNEESYSADSEEAIKILQENSLFKGLTFEVGVFNQRISFPHNQKTLPYIENYPEKQLIDHLTSLSNVDFKREIEQLIHRSPLYSKTVPLQKIRKLSKDDLSSTFKDMIFVHREYAHLYRNNLKHILSDSKGKLYNTLDCLEALRSLEKSINLSHMHNYFLTLNPTALLKFWSVIFEALDSKNLFYH